MREFDVVEGVKHSRMWHEALDELQYGAVPVVCVMHGAVVGGDLEPAAAAHVRVAETSAFCALPESQRGIFVGGGASARLPRLIGVARVADMMLTRRSYTAEESQQIGTSQCVVGRGEGLSKAMELARKIAGNAPMTNFAVTHVPAADRRDGAGSGARDRSAHRRDRPECAGGEGAGAKLPVEAGSHQDREAQ